MPADSDQNAEKQSEPVSDDGQSDAATTGDAKESVELPSCDGENTVTVAKDLTGEPLAHSLMDQWKRDNAGRDWVAEEKKAHAFKPPADNSGLLQGEQGKGHVYGNYTERDILTWQREAEKFVAEGSRIFHSADELGSTVAVSCDMCHPHAANTHPEKPVRNLFKRHPPFPGNHAPGSRWCNSGHAAPFPIGHNSRCDSPMTR